MDFLQVNALTPEQSISSKDVMFVGDHADHYFAVGNSALKCVLHALLAADKSNVSSILDFPCGHGRVLRYLRAKFPQAAITACDLDRDAVDFCVKTFDCKGLYSQENLAGLALADQFDLIWCGSLLTHLDKPRWPDVIGFLYDHLKPGGLAVFSFHGRNVARRMKQGEHSYGLPTDGIADICAQYQQAGFGYVNFADGANYGVSLTAPSWVMRQIESRPGLRTVYFAEAVWDHHHDVLGCVREGGVTQVEHAKVINNASEREQNLPQIKRNTVWSRWFKH